MTACDVSQGGAVQAKRDRAASDGNSGVGIGKARKQPRAAR